jgi:CcmD family protein
MNIEKYKKMKISYRNKLLMKAWKQIPAVLLLTLVSTLHALAQGSQIEMADRLREDGKIWVVVGVIVLIFIGIAIYLVLLDRKVARLEKQVKQDRDGSVIK